MLELEIIDANGNRAQHCLGIGNYKLGSSEECEIPLIDEFISRHHADITIDNIGAALKDVGSTNGIWNGDERLSNAQYLQTGDSFRMGECVLRVLDYSDQKESEHLDDLVTLQPESVIKKSSQVDIHAANDLEKQEPKEVREFKRTVHQSVLEYLDLHKRAKIHKMSSDKLREEAAETAKQVIKSDKIPLPKGYSEAQLITQIVAEAIGLGPIEPYLDDDSITEIMVNGPDQIFVERNGKLEHTGTCFNSAGSLMSIIERVVTPLGRRIDEGSPMVDARLPDGSRVNAIIPPLSLVGPVITIRKFSRKRFAIDDLVSMGTLDENIAEFLQTCVENRRNIVVSGGTGSGKTTTLNVLSNFIPSTERIVTIEDAAELQLNQDHIISLESRPSNIEGKGRVAIRDLVKNSLRMRPDRIVVGECRGGEALDMLQAMNTGHDGSLTTGHANSPRDLLSRLEVMVLMSGMDLPVRAIREQISSAVDVILQQTRFSDGKRRITSIVEIDGMEGDTILLQPIFKYSQTGRDDDGNIVGKYEGLGYAPNFYAELEASGVKIDRSIFGEASGLPDTGQSPWEQNNA